MALKGKVSDQAAVELFLDMIAAERGGAKNSLAAYARDLTDLSAYLAGTKRRLVEASSGELRSYLASLGSRGLAAASVARTNSRPTFGCAVRGAATPPEEGVETSDFTR